MPAEKVSVVPAGIEVARFTPKSPTQHDPSIILALCYLIKRKGIDLLIRAFATVAATNPRARLWIVGNGPEEASLKKLARELGVARRVRFWGFVDNRQVSKYYAEAGVFVSPTRFEPFGQTFLEAMAAGLPVVASEVGGIPDIVTPAVGRLHPVDDQAALAAILDELLTHPSLLRKMGVAARARVVQHYDWSVIMNQYLAVWEKLSERPKRR